MASLGDGDDNGPKSIRIGYVPEHYLIPLHLAKPHFSTHLPSNVSVDLIPFPQGTGHMITSLRANELDLAIGLTEGWIAGLLKSQPQQSSSSPSALEDPDPGYRLVGQWVKSPLRWSIVTSADRDDINTVDDLKVNNKVGVSRMGSGSHIMSFVLAQQQGWLNTSNTSSSDQQEESEKKEALEFIPLGGIKDLIDGMTSHKADFFMWEHFTTKPYFHPSPPSSSSEETKKVPLKWVSEIYTPWPSWHIAANTTTFPPSSSTNTLLDTIFKALNEGIKEFKKSPTKIAVEMLTNPARPAGCFYSEEDTLSWLENVEFFDQTKSVDYQMARGVVDTLRKAGVVPVSKRGGEGGEWTREDAQRIGIFR